MKKSFIINKVKAEELISENFHPAWKKSYLGQIWKNLQPGQVMAFEKDLAVTNLGPDKFGVLKRI